MTPAKAASAVPSSAGERVRQRVQSVDILRGLVMIVMALDHVRDFFHYGAEHFDPTDFTQTTPVLFFTRWITHYCAPTFMFLAGTGAYLQSRRGKSKAEVARFLWTRGLWLVILENTWVRWLGWRMNFGNDQIFLWVIWALGISMIALAALIYVPRRILLPVSLAVIVLHNALDGIAPAQFGSLAWLWKILHVRDVIIFSGSVTIFNTYPLIPWIFVMSAGYCFGRVLDLGSEQRRMLLLKLGGGMIAAFVILRAIDIYGDPQPWLVQANPILTICSFLNCTKYPPSLLYLLMTLGPGMVIMGLTERWRLRETNPLIVFGRVPMFYYLLHLPMIHIVAIALAGLRYGRVDFMFHNPPSLAGPTEGFPTDYGYSLAIVYVIWIGVVVALYPACRWFARVKQQHPSRVLSYF